VRPYSRNVFAYCHQRTRLTPNTKVGKLKLSLGPMLNGYAACILNKKGSELYGNRGTHL
jgi:hypothetical protein